MGPNGIPSGHGWSGFHARGRGGMRGGAPGFGRGGWHPL